MALLFFLGWQFLNQSVINSMSNSQNQEEECELRTYRYKKYPPSTCVENLTYMLIRPPRLIYNQELLNPAKRYGKRFKHTVYHIPFPLSLYEPSQMEYIFLYLHGNSSSRLQGFLQLSNIPINAGLACFDFDGCGNRQQKQFISLGKQQSVEVDKAVLFLRQLGYTVVGWGRSMGSVSLLLSSECKIVVADSPFSSLKVLCQQQAESQVPCVFKSCFYCLIPCVFCTLDRDLKKKSDFCLEQLEIFSKINEKNSERSILFLAATQDALIKYTHSQKLYTSFQGRKQILLFPGDHNSQRSKDVMAQVFIWVQNEILKQQVKIALPLKRHAPKKVIPNKMLFEMNKIQDQFASNSQSYGQTNNLTSKDRIGVDSIYEKDQLFEKVQSETGP